MDFDLIGKALTGADIIDAGDAFDEDDRRRYMNASEALYCIRRQWYMKNTETPPQDWGYARRGKLIEEWNVKCLRAAGVDIRLAGGDQESLYSDKHQISATPDGIIVTNEHLIGVELKSIDPRTNRGNLPKKGHPEQLQLGMALVNLIKADLGLPDLPFAGGIVHYTDASNLNDQLSKPVPFIENMLDKMKPRASRLFAAKSAEKLPREGKLAGGSECRLCPFTGPCGAGGAGADVGREEVKESRLTKAVASYLNGKATEDAGKKEKDAAAEQIKSALQTAGKKVEVVDGHTITLSEVAGRKTIDRKAVEEAGIDLSPFEKTGAPSERLVVK